MSKPFMWGPRLQRVRDSLSGLADPALSGTVGATVGVLLLETKEALETLLIQRTERHDDPWSGQIGFPGGKIKVSDGSVRAALVREVEEEVGVDLGASGEELGPLSTGNPMRRLELKVQPWVYGLHSRPAVHIGPEVSSAFWVSLPELATNRTRSEVTIRGENWTVECFNVNNKIVWGYTYRVLTELLTLPGVLTVP